MELISCRSCGKEISTTTIICPNCGASAASAVVHCTCPKCGNYYDIVRNGACPKCGTPAPIKR